MKNASEREKYEFEHIQTSREVFCGLSYLAQDSIFKTFQHPLSDFSDGFRKKLANMIIHNAFIVCVRSDGVVLDRIDYHKENRFMFISKKGEQYYIHRSSGVRI